jgi:L-threonylcarbamoyladenylate synthase
MENDIVAAVDTLKKGGIILYPTDTIWGIGCDATNREAVARIYEVKERADEKSMLILMDDADNLYDYVEQVPDIAWTLLEVADKPLTIIYPKAVNLAENLVAEDGSIGIRVVKDEFCRKMISRFGKPIVSTSANISGKPWPPNFQKIEKSLLKKMDYIVSHRQKDEMRGKPSGIIKVGLNGEVLVIRE